MNAVIFVFGVASVSVGFIMVYFGIAVIGSVLGLWAFPK